ncbi:restriction endonuclease subunit S [Algiphilus sp.]|uniref:restriction endonuclease subunit S n=1 Tax=Algiphilus sp. TaxID=1872431 RepID=UPI003C63ABEF
MKAERLLELYDRISEAPDAVSRLRRFVLDLAVRGKLVAQDPGDESPANLLLKVKEERERAIKEGIAKPRKKLDSISEAPFDLPANWLWTQLGEIALYIQRGKSPKYASSEGIPVISQKCVQWQGLDLDAAKQITWESLETYDATRFLRHDDLLWNSTGTGTIGRVIRVRHPSDSLVCDSHVTVVRLAVIDPEYVRIWLRSDHVYGTIEGSATGSTNQVELTARYANNLPVPLPPLAEQHRIVAKVDELMALCDRLEEQHGTREATRDRLTTAILSRLTAPDNDEQSFRDHARFALDTFPSLTARPDQIKALRQTILDLAVRGKLVNQEPEDESATELFKRLSKAKEEAFAAEDLRKRQPVSESAQELGSVHAPGSWVQAKFDDVLVIVSGVTKGQKLSDHESIEANYMRVANVQRGFLDLSVVKKIKVRTTDFVRYRLECGDVLMTEGGDWDKLGRAAVWRGQLSDCIHQNHVFRLRPPSPELLPEWVVLFANSAVGRSFFAEASKRTTNLASINMTQLRSCPLPLPPTSEQRRIVAKVDELMALCDRLEANLQQADHKRARLLESLLAEALAPAEAALEAA